MKPGADRPHESAPSGKIASAICLAPRSVGSRERSTGQPLQCGKSSTLRVEEDLINVAPARFQLLPPRHRLQTYRCIYALLHKQEPQARERERRLGPKAGVITAAVRDALPRQKPEYGTSQSSTAP